MRCRHVLRIGNFAAGGWSAAGRIDRCDTGLIQKTVCSCSNAAHFDQEKTRRGKHRCADPKPLIKT